MAQVPLPADPDALLDYLHSVPRQDTQHLLTLYTRALASLKEDRASLQIFLEYMRLATPSTDHEDLEQIYSLMKVKLRTYKEYWLCYIDFEVNVRGKSRAYVLGKSLEYLRVKEFPGKETLIAELSNLLDYERGGSEAADTSRAKKACSECTAKKVHKDIERQRDGCLLEMAGRDHTAGFEAGISIKRRSIEPLPVVSAAAVRVQEEDDEEDRDKICVASVSRPRHEPTFYNERDSAKIGHRMVQDGGALPPGHVKQGKGVGGDDGRTAFEMEASEPTGTFSRPVDGRVVYEARDAANETKRSEENRVAERGDFDCRHKNTPLLDTSSSSEAEGEEERMKSGANALFECSVMDNTLCFEKKYMPSLTFKDKEVVKLSRIGKGGYSEVYRVLMDGEVYALKQIRVTDREGMRACRDEIFLLEKLTPHECVIKMIDYQFLEDTVNIVLEHGEIDLQKMIQAGPMSIFLIKYLWESILKTLEFIHSNRIVHRDIKPANFVLVRGCLKLIDFGISKSIRGDTTSILNVEKAGTLNYISPEQCTGQRVGRASDMWSAGCILYNMIYRRNIHSCKTVMDVVRTMTEERPIFYGNADPLAVQCMKMCLVYDPKKRAKPAELLSHPFLAKETGGDTLHYHHTDKG